MVGCLHDVGTDVETCWDVQTRRVFAGRACSAFVVAMWRGVVVAVVVIVVVALLSGNWWINYKKKAFGRKESVACLKGALVCFLFIEKGRCFDLTPSLQRLCWLVVGCPYFFCFLLQPQNNEEDGCPFFVVDCTQSTTYALLHLTPCQALSVAHHRFPSLPPHAFESRTMQAAHEDGTATGTVISSPPRNCTKLIPPCAR